MCRYDLPSSVPLSKAMATAANSVTHVMLGLRLTVLPRVVACFAVSNAHEQTDLE